MTCVKWLLLLFVVVALSVGVLAQQVEATPPQGDGAVSCVVLFVQAPSESPQPLDFCHGVVVLDYTGEAWVKLPDGFDSRARDLRYQLTPIGKPSPNLHVASEVSRNRFHIAGGRMRQRISWQVIGLRSSTNATASLFNSAGQAESGTD